MRFNPGLWSAACFALTLLLPSTGHALTYNELFKAIDGCAISALLEKGYEPEIVQKSDRTYLILENTKDDLRVTTMMGIMKGVDLSYEPLGIVNQIEKTADDGTAFDYSSSLVVMFKDLLVEETVPYSFTSDVDPFPETEEQANMITLFDETSKAYALNYLGILRECTVDQIKPLLPEEERENEEPDNAA